jgi:predicted RND superfamily exporter protein
MILIRWRWATAISLFLLVAFLTPGLQTALVPDNALTVWFLESDPKLQNYKRFQRSFGNDEVILLQVHESRGLFNEDALTRMRRLVGLLEAVDGIERVHSVFSLKNVVIRDGGPTFEPAIPESLPDDLDSLKSQILNNSLALDRLINADGTRAMLWVQMEVMADIDVKRDAIITEVRDIADMVMGDLPHPMGGVGVIYSGLNVLTQHDFSLFVGIGYLLMFVSLWWVFRNIRLVLAVMGVIVMATVGALGIYGLMGYQINMFTIVLPILIIVLGIADAIHIPSAFVQELRSAGDRSREQIILGTLKRTLLPCLFTTLTTMAGFLALTSSPMAVIRHLGTYAAIGVGIAFAASVTLMIPTLFAIPQNARLPEHRRLNRFLDSARGLLLRYPLPIAVVSGLLCALGVLGASRVVSDTYTIGYLPDHHQVVRDHRALESGWGDYSPLEFMVIPQDGLTVEHPRILAGTERFVAAASSLPHIRKGFGLHTVYRHIASKVDPDLPADLPISSQHVAEIGRFRDKQAFHWDRNSPAYHDNFLAPLMTEDGSLGRLTLIGSMLSAAELERLLADLEPLARNAMDGAATLEPSGYPPLYVTIINYVMTSQKRSFFIALGLIFLLMLLWLRSFRLALVSLIPNVFPVLVMLGVMGVLNVHLDIGTATVAAIVLGVAIDDTVHFLHHWRDAEKAGSNWQEAVEHTFRRAGVPAVITTALLLVGYSVLMLADLATVFYFGLLTTVAAVATLFADLLILPLLLRLFGGRR